MSIQIKTASTTGSNFSAGTVALAGNAPFPPETAEYKVITALARRADKTVNRLNIKVLKKLIPPASSFEEIAIGFLYNNCTGNDDEITFKIFE